MFRNVQTNNSFQTNSRNQINDIIYQLHLSTRIFSASFNFTPFKEAKKEFALLTSPCEWNVLLIDISCFRLKIAGATCTYVSDFNIGGVTMLSKNFFCKDQNAHENFQATSSPGFHSWTDSHDLMSFGYVSFWDLKVEGETFSYIEY